MIDNKRRWADLMQNLLITLLSISAVALFAQMHLYSLENSILHNWLTPPAVSGSSAALSGQTGSLPLAVPVRVAVSGEDVYGRYGNLTLTTADETFAPLSTLLTESIGSAYNPAASSRSEFLASLSRTSVYYDFLHALPISVLVESAETPAYSSTASARCLVVSAAQDHTAQLLMWDGTDTYLRFETAVSPDDLDAAVNLYELGSAYFAFDYAGLNEHYAQVAPCSLFLSALPSLPELAVSASLTSTQHILSLLGFNPYTNSRYTESNGTEVIVDGDHSLRILPGGRIRYQGGSESMVSIESESAVPTLQEAVSGISTLLNQLLSGISGDASLYLLDIQQFGNATTLEFGYQYNGVPIRFSDGTSAAQVRLSGSSVTSLSLYFRQYTVGSDSSLLLPLPQTIAIAAEQPGKELFLGYTDSGRNSASAGWLLE